MSVNFVNGIVWPIASIVTRLRYFNNCTAIVIGIVILICGLSPSSSAPTTSEWVSNPCSKLPLLRHGRSPSENQLKMFIYKIDANFFKEIRSIYNPTESKQAKGNCPRINNMLKPIKNADTVFTATEAFYETLLQFAFFIEKLKDTPIKTAGEFNVRKRKLIFEEAKENLRLVICEFNDTLSKYDNKNMQPNKPKVPKMNMKCLPRIMDHSQAHIMDTDFFKKMKKFLKQGRRLLKQKKQRNGKKVVKKSEPKGNRRTRKLKQ